jgi:hypothetical protein
MIGPSFASELEAAGLFGLPFSWGPDGVFGRENLTAAQRKKLDAVIAAHDPKRPAPQPRVVTALAFMERLSQAKRIAIRQAARQPGGEALDDWLDMLRAAQEVNLDDPRTQEGVHALLAFGLLTEAEAKALLA